MWYASSFIFSHFFFRYIESINLTSFNMTHEMKRHVVFLSQVVNHSNLVIPTSLKLARWTSGMASGSMQISQKYLWWWTPSSHRLWMVLRIINSVIPFNTQFEREAVHSWLAQESKSRHGFGWHESHKVRYKFGLHEG